MQLKWNTLRTKLLALYIGLLLIPILGTGIYAQSYLSQLLEEQAILRERYQLEVVATHTRYLFSDTQRMLQYIVATRAVQVLENSAPNTDLYNSSLDVLRRDLHQLLRTNATFRRVAVYNPLGEAVVALEVDRADRQIREADTEPLDGFIGQVLTAPPETMHMLVDRHANNTTSELILAFRAADSVVLLSFLAEQLFVPILDEGESGTWSVQLPTQTTLHYTTGDRSLLPALDRNDNWLRFNDGFYRDGTNLTLFQRIAIPTQQDAYDVVLFHTLPADTLQVNLDAFFESFTLLTLGVILCVIALGLFAITRFIDPIQQLKQAVDTMRKTQSVPDLPQALPPDEIGELSLAFYTMASELAQKRQSERALVDKLINAQEEERKRVAYELHDGLIQQLVGARLQLSQAQNQSADGPNTAYQQGYDALSGAIVEGRRIMQGLHPSILDDLGIREALEELCAMMNNRAGWDMQHQLEPLTIEPDKVISMTLYRITQEALSNIYKHAAASTVRVQLWQDDGYHLVIEDDGSGFNTTSRPTSQHGWGLRTMTERVDLLHGRINIESDLGHGTKIIVELPQKATTEGGENR